MAYNRTIKNKNTGYYLVGKRAFHSLGKAEQYCDKNGLDVDKEIRSENDDIKELAHTIANTNIALLEDIMEKCQVMHEEKLAKTQKVSDDYNTSLNNRDLLREYKNEQADRCLGVLEGMSLIRQIILNELHESQQILHI